MAGTVTKSEILRNSFSWLLVVCCCCLLQAQKTPPQAETVKLFSLQDAALQYETYPWGNELSLAVVGSADTTLKQCSLSVTVWYCGECARSQSILLPAAPDGMETTIRFSEHWGPLNNAWEDVLSGEYEIRVELQFDQQPPHLRTPLEKLLAGRPIQAQSKKLYWGNQEAFRREDTAIKAFFSERMAKLHRLTQQLDKNVQLAMSVPQAIRKNQPNAFRRTGYAEFDAVAWRTWLSNFLAELEQEHKAYNTFHKKIFSRRYGVAKNSLNEYYGLMLRLAKISSLQVYKTNKLKADSHDTNIDSFGLEKTDVIQLNLQRLMKMAADELRLELGKILK